MKREINRRDLIFGGASFAALGGAAAYTKIMRSKDTVQTERFIKK